MGSSVSKSPGSLSTWDFMRFLRKKRGRGRRKKRSERREGKEMKEQNLKGDKKKARGWGPFLACAETFRQKWESPEKAGISTARPVGGVPVATSHLQHAPIPGLWEESLGLALLGEREA